MKVGDEDDVKKVRTQAMKLAPPVTYQGGKGRLAGQIIDIIQPSGPFFDLCCGSGAITIELLNRGYSDPITMVDSGPWGLVWQEVCNGTFNIEIFRKLIQGMPEPRQIQKYLQELSSFPASEYMAPLSYLVLQAGSFGGKAIWLKDGRWRNASFRSYWEPTDTSNRRSPVNPMMPMPGTLLERMEALCEAMPGRVRAIQANVHEITVNGIAYVDPPYVGTTGYEGTFDVVEFAKKQPCPVWVSEGRSLSDESMILSAGRAKGGISGDRKRAANEEWLTPFNQRRFKT